ncbi:MAG: magnesium transporter [Candidatus Omnitrophica bacterium]|nr:magnesium transporter [Candidatus Omnitrophota bacterium]
MSNQNGHLRMQQQHSVKLLLPEIKEILRDKDYSLLKVALKECNPIGLAGCWQNFTEEEQLQIFSVLPGKSALSLFEVLEIEDQRKLLEKLSEDSVTPLLNNLDLPDVAKIFHKMSSRNVRKMRNLIKRQKALAHVDLLMQYPHHSAGSLMHPEFIKLEPKMTAKQALSVLSAITRPGEKEHLFALFVVDEESKVLGSLTLQDLLSVPENEKLSELMTSVEDFKLSPVTDQEEVAKIFTRFDLNSAPVVDKDGKLIGVLTVKDIINVERQEATEDIAKMVGTASTDIRQPSVLRALFYRMPWLLVTLGGGMFTSYIIKSFEPVLAKVIALASFSPLLAGMGGNVGAQTATIIVRSIALGQLNKESDRVKTILREIRVGLMLGLGYGIALGFLAYALYGDRYHWQFSFCVAFAMFTSMAGAAFLGAVEPLLFHRVGIDPATATGPLITTITDILTNLTYYTLATILLMNM